MVLPAYGVHGLGDVFEDEVEVQLVLFFALLGGMGMDGWREEVEEWGRARVDK